MGVHGLWKLIEASGKPVPLETLENKVLAVDVSIWLHHFIKGFQDGMGAPVPNAHLLGIYHRLCKLLYFRIKPVFVFDGGVPALKRRTMELRNQRKSKNMSEADRIHKNLLSALVKHSAISKVLSEKAKAAITAQTSPTKKTKLDTEDELYVLPPSQLDSTVSSSSEEEEEDSPEETKYDLHSIDTQSNEFKALPVEMRHEILTDLKETRKQSSWGRINEMPAESDDFSVYQMRRLLKRQSVQTALEEAEKEMGGHSLSLGELEKILKDQGVISNMKGNRIASDENTRFLLIKDIKQAFEDAKKQTEEEKEETKDKADQELDEDLAKAIALSLEEAPSTSKEEQPSSSTDQVKKIGGKGKSRMPLSFLADFDEADFGFDSESSEEETVPMRLTPAQRYMMEYSNLTPSEIAKILASRRGKAKEKEIDKEETTKTKNKKEDVVEVIEQKNDKSLEKAESSVEKISDSESGSCDDFLEVDDTKGTAVEEGEDKDSSSGNTEQRTEAPVEVVSDSESSSCDDLVEVEESKKTESAPTMEVVIKPGEEIEDDLFKDVFEAEDKKEKGEPQLVEVSKIQNKIISSEDRKEKVEPKAIEVSKTQNKIISSEDIQPKAIEVPKIQENIVSTNSEDVGKQIVSTVEEQEKFSKTKINEMVKTYTANKEPKSSKITVEQLNEMKNNLRKEQTELAVARSSKERLAGNITDQMYQEAQELLELFGVPYIIAPMEAEAQCAFLELVDLTDGTITDDSDIWLFGGRTVYKNFFNQSKYVLEFKSESIQHHYKLSREQMILLAMLVGSDYTIGLSGVGPVTALEILAAFPPKKHLLSGLAEFKSWFRKGMGPGPGRSSLRGKLKNVTFNENFPNTQIIDAYLDPKVETSKEKFSWGKLDVVGLVDFAKHKFGWTKTKAEELLNPVLKRLEETRTQKSITDFFKYQVKVDSTETKATMSKRVRTALDRIGKGEVDEEPPKVKKPRVTKGEGKKRRKELDKVEEDEEINILKETEEKSLKRVEEIEKEVHREVEQQQKKVNLQKLHRRELIPQKQRDKTDMLHNKLKAIETFRKSKQGPGYVKKREKAKQQLKKDTSYLSEEGSSSD